ncbi:MAG: acyl carrier protein, partial [Moorea sp. SIO2I5]|nr:acyl carrier protein [Moorena sp. SIO2I5]
MVNSVEVNSELMNSINNEVKQIVANLLQIDVNELEVDTPFLEMGADSLVLMEAINNIQDRFHVKIPIRDLFGELGTLNAVVDYIVKQQANSAFAPGEQPEAKQAPLHAMAEQTPQSFVPIQVAEPDHSYL